MRNTVPRIIPDIAINSMISESDDETVVILLLMLRPIMLRMRLMPMILMPDAGAVCFLFWLLSLA